jgi:DNA mismatch repair protein MutS
MALAKNDCSFIFATHLHALADFPEIVELPNLQLAHLKVVYDEASDTLIYDRKITPGSGMANYGIEIAKYIIREQPEFIEQCMRFRRRILDIPDTLLKPRKSKYNANVIIDTCQICNKPGEDVHHIHEQCSADADQQIQSGELKHHKNIEANLVVLCKRCHINTHHWIDGTQIRIQGYKMTTQGRKLDYTIEKS